MRASLAAVTVLAGCAASVDPDRGAGEGHATSVHVVTTRVTGAAGRTTARAAFVRVPDERSSDDAARTLGLSPDLPGEGTCRAIDALPSTKSVAELVDAGEVWLVEGVGSERLVARAFPDVLGLSGVVYTSGGDGAARLDAGARVRWTGAHGVERSDVPLGGEPSPPGAVRAGDTVTFEPDDDGERTWLDVTDTRGARRCRVARGAGSFSLDARLDALVAVHRDRHRTEGAVTVRREVVEMLGRPAAPSGS